MDELDLLKKDWNRKADSFRQVSEKEIYAMLHKKSSSIVKWILIISILEILLWTGLSFLGNSEEYVASVKISGFRLAMDLITYFNYGVIFTFICLFYNNFRRISTTASTRQLMKDILRTRKTVNYYVWYNLSMILLMMTIGFAVSFLYNPQLVLLREQTHGDWKVNAIMIAIIVGCLAVFFAVFWLFYRLIYGRLLRRLNANYKELKKIDF